VRVQQAAGKHVVRAIKSGLIPKAKTLVCVDCGNPARDYDHRHYGEPLNVVPVCRSCNLKRGPAEDLRRLVLSQISA
jgi:hypothetical protein